MSVSQPALSRALHHLSQVAPVSYRRIFAGIGLYHQQYLFAIMADDRLYFRVDDASRQPYLDRAMSALQPRGAGSSLSHFYQLPDAVLEDSSELLFWMRAAVEASQAPLPEPAYLSAPPQSPARRFSAG